MPSACARFSACAIWLATWSARPSSSRALCASASRRLLPFDELEREEERAVVELAEVGGGGDVGVIDVRGGHRFALEARHDLGEMAHLLVKHLHREPLSHVRVLGLVDRAHAPLAEQTLDTVTPADGLPDERRRAARTLTRCAAFPSARSPIDAFYRSRSRRARRPLVRGRGVGFRGVDRLLHQVYLARAVPRGILRGECAQRRSGIPEAIARIFFATWRGFERVPKGPQARIRPGNHRCRMGHLAAESPELPVAVPAAVPHRGFKDRSRYLTVSPIAGSS